MRRILCSFLCLLILCTAFTACGGEDEKEPQEQGEEMAADNLRRTVLYYQDENGLMVPVMKAIPWEEGIGKAALSNLTAEPDNVSLAASLGLLTTLPAGTGFELRIRDGGAATVNIIGAGKFETAQQEKNAVISVVNTLMEFPAIQSVKVEMDGKGKGSLPFGTELGREYTRIALNCEAAAAMGGDPGANAVTLYFSNYEATLNVPVTRSMPEEPTLESAVEALIEGPEQIDALRSCFPEGTRLLDVAVESGVAVVNLSAEFENILEHPALTQRALDTLSLTTQQFGVSSVRVEVEGEEFEPQNPILAPLYANRLQ